MEKISSADLMTQAQGMFKSQRVYSFINDLDVDSNTALIILDFLKDYSDMLVESKKSDRKYYEKIINNLEGKLDDTSNQLRDIAAELESWDEE